MSPDLTAIGLRIGPVYATADATGHLVTPKGNRVGASTVRRLARQGRLVAFKTNDDRWAFPSWSFDRTGGLLHVNEDVLALWEALPAGGFLTDMDRAVWMATPLRALGGTPVEYVRQHGVASPPRRMPCHVFGLGCSDPVGQADMQLDIGLGSLPFGAADVGAAGVCRAKIVRSEARPSGCVHAGADV